MIINKCPICGKIYSKTYKTKYCSQHCFGMSRVEKMTGNKNPAKRMEVRKKISKSLTGKSPSLETRKKMSLAKKGKPGYWLGKKRPELAGKNNGMWKGDGVGYHPLHAWVSRKLGKPSFCEICKKSDKKNYEWANISGEYKRDLSDWKRLCVSCHMKFDGQHKKMWKTRRAKNV